MATTSNPTTNPNPQAKVNALLTEIEAMRAENARITAQLTAKASGRISLKVTEKGGLSVYGLQRFPVTLYREQWEAVMARKDEILAACAKLPVKADKSGF